MGEEVVIAIEIPMGAAVAGPFAIDQAAWIDMIRRVIAAAASAGSDHSLAVGTASSVTAITKSRVFSRTLPTSFAKNPRKRPAPLLPSQR